MFKTNQFGYISCLIVISTLIISLPQHQSHAGVKKKDNGGKKNQELFEHAKTLSQDNDATGKKLMKILANDKDLASVFSKAVDQRIQAGQLLGEMRYLPAIPQLVRNIELSPVISGSNLPPFCQVLANYGDAAVPAIVEQVLKDDVAVIGGLTVSVEFKGVLMGHSTFPLFQAIKKGNTFKVARIYAHGIAAVSPNNKKIQEKVEVFLNKLKKYENSK